MKSVHTLTWIYAVLVFLYSLMETVCYLSAISYFTARGNLRINPVSALKIKLVQYSCKNVLVSAFLWKAGFPFQDFSELWRSAHDPRVPEPTVAFEQIGRLS